MKLPRSVTWVVVVICVAPFLLHLLGFDFASPVPGQGQVLGSGFHESDLPGAFTHTILEWSAFSAAIFTVFLAFVHFGIKRDVTTPVIGLALFFAGGMDAFHTLAADRLISAVAPNTDLIPFTWAICRLFNAGIMIAGVSILLIRKQTQTEGGVKFVLLSSAIFLFAAYGIIHYCAQSQNLPRTQYEEGFLLSFITRPWDVGPLILFLFAGLVVYPRFHRMAPSLFTHSLVISAIPDVATQVYMAFGSDTLYDHNFNVAHFLKIVSYLVPLTGLALDYIRTYREEEDLSQRLIQARDNLAEQSLQLEVTNQDLLRRNKELDEFTYVASHDLQEPLRKLTSFSTLLKKDAGAFLPERANRDLEFITDAAHRMQTLVWDLLALSKVGRSEMRMADVRMDDCVDRALEALAERIKETEAKITRSELPTVWGDATMLAQLYQNLIGNALKFTLQDTRPEIKLSAVGEEGSWIFRVQDNGIGIDWRYAEQVFEPFKRLHSRGAYEGSGIGLSICRKTVERHGGRIWIGTEQGNGAIFKFALPKGEVAR